MYMPPDTRLKLSEQDEYVHEPEPVGHYNESMYFNAFDTQAGLGLWVRIGNRPHEGHAEMSCCVYLPDGRVGFMFARPAIQGNHEMAAAGMRFEVLEPFKRLRVTYEGALLLMDDPLAMADPSSAFKRYPKRPASITLDFEGISPMHGGEIVTLDGHPIELDPEHAVYRGHTEQHMAVSGHITVDGCRHEIVHGTGYRDKSWGPRHWHSFSWYKWLPVTFSRDFGFLLSIKPSGALALPVSGNVLRQGVFEPVIEGRIEPTYDAQYLPTGLKVWIRTQIGEYHLTGRVLTTVPLRHKARAGADPATYTRITESMTSYQWADQQALGMTEFCDVMVGGIPRSVVEANAR